jgi:acyl-CoA synthetase (AMP-forming)/AMP-acid ligase II
MPFFWVGGLAITLFPTLEVGGVVTCQEKPAVAVLPLGNVSRGGEAEPPPGWKAFSSLGMTETFAIYAWGTVSLVPGYPYVPLDFFETGCQVKVVDPLGQPVPDGGRGQIVVRGPSVTPGHHKVPRSTYFDADGFFRTGDEGLVDGDRIHFLGRLGDMIKTRMANVAPPEVEQEIVALDGVATAYVVAVDDATLGQAVGAAVVPEEGAELTPDAIAAALRAEISSFKVPRVMIIVPNDEIPVTPSNKLDKRALAAMIADRGVWVAR